MDNFSCLKSILSNRKSELAVGVIFALVSKSKSKIILAKKLAEELNISESYLQQVSRPLLSHRLIKSYRGPSGGYSLAKSINSINVTEILRTVDASAEIPYKKSTLNF